MSMAEVELLKIEKGGSSRKPFASLGINKLYMNSILAKELKNKGWRHVEIAYACRDDKLIVLLEKKEPPTDNSYKICYKHYNKRYKGKYRELKSFYAEIHCRMLSNLLTLHPKARTERIIFDDDKLWLIFRGAQDVR